MRSFNKIFVIALPRCATVSLCEGLGVLGVRIAHLGKIFGESTPPHNDPLRLRRMHEQISAGDFVLDVLKQCDGLVDYPACIPNVFENLDRHYPGSLFINVRRDGHVSRWLQSVERQFVGLQLIKTGHNATAEEREFMQVMHSFRAATFGQAEFDAAKYRQAYDRHQQHVTDYFSGRPDDLLDIHDLSVLDQQGFVLLGNFLNCAAPALPFPRSNVHSSAPEEAFMAAMRAKRVQSQTGIELEI